MVLTGKKEERSSVAVGDSTTAVSFFRYDRYAAAILQQPLFGARHLTLSCGDYSF
jgi:hypothetical protein